MCKVKEWMGTLTEVVEMTKKEYALTVAASLLGGIVIGFVFAPKRIKHTTIGSHNGSDNSHNGNDNGNGYGDEELFEDWEDPEEENNVIHFN